MADSVSTKQIALETAAVFAAALGSLLALAPTAPFTKELGVCESGAVRDVLAGNLLLPHFIPGPMVHVPPLYWWTAALGVRAFGWSELALRLPAIVPAALTCAIVFAWTFVTIGRRAGLWAAAALLLCHFFLDAARQPRMDSMLALFVTAAAVCVERAVSSRRSFYFARAALSIGLGALTKGVLGIVLPGLVIAFYLLVRKRFWELFRLDLMAAFAVGLAIGLAWYVAGYAIGGHQFLEWQLGMNLWNRFIPTGVGGAGYCAHPFWYFVPQTVNGFLPWSLYLPALIAALWPRRECPLPEPVIYAICWFAAIFIFFSSSQGKCLVYILPVFPPLAVLTGWLIAKTQTGFSERPWVIRLFRAGSAIIGVGALAIAAAALAIVIFGVPPRMPLKLHPTDQRFLEIFGAMAAARTAALIACLGASLIGINLIRQGVWRQVASTQALGALIIAAAGSWFWFGVMNPALAERESLRIFAREVVATVPADAQIGHIGLEDCDLYFYSSRPIAPVFRFTCDAGQTFPRYIVIRKRRFEAMLPRQRACLNPVLESAPVDSNGPRILVEQSATAH